MPTREQIDIENISCLRAIHDYIAKHGKSPSCKDLNAMSVWRYRVHQLWKRRYIEMEQQSARSIKITAEGYAFAGIKV